MTELTATQIGDGSSISLAFLLGANNLGNKIRLMGIVYFRIFNKSNTAGLNGLPTVAGGLAKLLEIGEGLKMTSLFVDADPVG